VKVVLITIVVAFVVFLIVKFLIEMFGLTDALVIVLSVIIGYYLAKDI